MGVAVSLGRKLVTRSGAPAVAAEPTRPIHEPVARSRPVVRGKFLHVDGGKLHVRGVTYGPFSPNESGSEYKTEGEVTRDFASMASLGINVVRTYTAVPRWLLDCAERAGLHVLVGIAWEQHITFLDRASTRRRIEQTIRQAVRGCDQHAAVLGFAIGNEIPPTIVRWYGARRIERFLERLYHSAKAEDPEALVTYVNYPTTEYLRLPFIDFVSFNIFLESRDAFTAYTARLQNIAGDRPLLLTELGLDSVRNGRDQQAQTVEWQVRAAFAGGAAGVCVFSWTDEWFRGGVDIDDWGFGLTDRDRRQKPAALAAARAFTDVPFPTHVVWPRVSIVVCTYNGARHIRDTCDALRDVDYPNFEVVIVCDGSTDQTMQILAEYEYQVIFVDNGGLSRARNIGWENATGEIVAYLDDDAYPDPQWLKHLVWTFLNSTHSGVGGPNIPPVESSFVAQCVANSPGGPNHVLLGDELAEHIPGCNMAFRRSALQRVSGFDPTFRIAGDDVDLCWRLQERGETLGFSPAAMVWHHRRTSVRRYLQQQNQYGRAEAMLSRKWPQKFNTAGHVSWGGRIYGDGVALPVWSRRMIYQGTWGTAAFQTTHERPISVLAALPMMPEWHLVVATLASMSLLGVLWPPFLWALVGLVPALVAPIVQAIRGGVAARLGEGSAGARSPVRARALIALLHFCQPVTRLHGRFGHGLRPVQWRVRGASTLGFATSTRWHETWRSAEERLAAVETTLRSFGVKTRRGDEFQRWDLDVRGGTLGGARLLMGLEEHGNGKQLVRFRVWPRPSAFAWRALGAALVLTAAAALLAADHRVIGLAALLFVALFGAVFLECADAAAVAVKAATVK